MITFSDNPQIAEQQMQAIIFYLTTFGYIDGDFDASEREFVAKYIEDLVARRVKIAMLDAEDNLRNELSEKYTRHFHEEFERIDRRVRDLFTEAVAADEEQDEFVRSRLKLRCFEIFDSFDSAGREALMETVDELLMADGVAHPAELKFRAELSELLDAEVEVELLEDGTRPPVNVTEAVDRVAEALAHPFFDRSEQHYSADREVLEQQLQSDIDLIEKTLDVIGEQRLRGAGKLRGVQKVNDLAGQEQFLDGHVYVNPLRPGKEYELTVLGDIHGCYSCLKAAVMQSRFFEKVDAYRKDPGNNPNPKLVLLGDYIDRGMFSLNGVLRTVMKIFTTAPDHVYMLRGNHEMYIEYKGKVFGGVRPAEAINSIKPYVSTDILRHYIRLFDVMPSSLLLGEILFVHGGIPRDLLLKERWEDLSSLDDPDIRFQMMWSDPSTADVIPAELQEQTARFPFGRLQAAAFLERLGCHTMVRGHEKVESGFERTYDDNDLMLLTLFSAGGEDNDDLPGDSSYRSVTPMALTMNVRDGDVRISPWRIQYKSFNDPEHNRFFKQEPEIEHRRE